MSSGIMEAQEWVKRRLTGAAIDRAYFRVAPEGVDQPFVVFDFVASREDAGVQARAGGHEMLFEVTAVGLTDSPLDLSNLEGVMHAALVGGIRETINGTQILGCWREEVVHAEEREGSLRWLHLGGVYAVQVVPSN